jgi:hypothetical protein
MSISPASTHPSSPSHFSDWHWQLGALVAFFVVALIVAGIAVRLDDESSSPIQRTTTQVSQSTAPVDSLAGSDLGGSIRHRTGNQP